ncbi:MAG TPA: hypothetical protein PLD23_05595 [Armatimonadota bacterium]|nr:hypothetical protein [Armatimonadota bacterium]
MTEAYAALSPVLLLLTFGLFVALMYARVMPALVALPAMAVALSIAGGMPWQRIVTVTLSEGALRLHAAYAAVIFGAVLSQVVQRAGVAEAIVKWAAELSGERPLLVTAVTAGVTMVLFTALSGLGGVIMVASIAFPILLAIGVRPLSIAGSFLIAVAIGGLMNVGNWQFFIETFGVQQSTLLSFAAAMMVVSVMGLTAFLWVDVALGGRRKLWATQSFAPRREVPPLAFLTPVVPIVLVAGFTWGGQLRRLPDFFEFPPIAAMACGILWGVATANGGGKGRTQLVAASATEGIRDAAPAIGIMIGIGMVVNAVMDPSVAGKLHPWLSRLSLRSPVAYVLAFGLGAPLALYRGPLNLFGLGAGIAVLLRDAGVVPAPAIAAALLAVGQVQGICDPTNTHNVWVSDYLGLDVHDVMKRTLPYAWAMALGGLVFAAWRFL